MSYKYKTSFSNEIVGSETLTSFDKLGISTASLENLKSLIPASIDLEKNIGETDFIIKNVDRSYDKMFKFLKDVDELSLSSGKPININLIKKVLKNEK